jgi:hypothetical protein
MHVIARPNSLLKNSRFVSGHRFSDTVNSSEGRAPSGLRTEIALFSKP